MHGANSATAIEKTFKANSKYNAIEIDITSFDGIPKLAHDVGVKHIDTTLESFLATVATIKRPYTIKFDFKDKLSIVNGINIIKNANVSEITNHVFYLHANTIIGPGGNDKLIMNSTEFINLSRTQLPTFWVSIGMRTDWNIKTLLFSHAYTSYHIQELAKAKNCILSLRMVILSQTSPNILGPISKNNLLIWGEKGFFEVMWLRNNPQFLIDQDVKSVNVWLMGTYMWLFVWSTLLIVILIYLLKNVTDYFEKKSNRQKYDMLPKPFLVNI